MPIIKILSGKQWALIEAERRELERLRAEISLLMELRPLYFHMQEKGFTMRDFVIGRAHISWNPRKAPRVDVKAMMEKGDAA